MAFSFNFIKFLCAFILINCVHAKYDYAKCTYFCVRFCWICECFLWLLFFTKVSIQTYCEENADRRIIVNSDGKYSSIVLLSSFGRIVPNESCQVKIVADEDLVAGMIVSVHNISLTSDECQDYLQVGPNKKWCTNDDAKNVVINSHEFDVEFVTGTTSSSQFHLVITAFYGIFKWQKYLFEWYLM